jgi:hypothetical protein
MFVRPEVYEKGMCRQARIGDGFLGNPLVTTVATAGALTLTVAAVLGGVASFTGAAGAVAYTMPTGADMIAAMPDMDIGDSYVFAVQNTAAQVATMTLSVGCTVSGAVTINAATRFCVLTKLTATTMNAHFL